MKAVVGELNDSCYMSFNVEIQNQPNDAWDGEKLLIKGSKSLEKGKFKATKGSITAPEKIYLNYRDLTTTVQIILTESKLAPLSHIRVGLPNIDRYNVSEFFLKGHLMVEQINVISAKKSIDGNLVMEKLKDGTKVNLLDKLFFIRLGDPLMAVQSIETSFGSLETIRNKSAIEI